MQGRTWEWISQVAHFLNPSPPPRAELAPSQGQRPLQPPSFPQQVSRRAVAEGVAPVEQGRAGAECHLPQGCLGNGST